MAGQPPPFTPAVWDIADAAAVQACTNGTATPEQQKRAMQWIITQAAQLADCEYRTDSRDHAFASGRRFVGLQISKLLMLSVSALQTLENQKENNRGQYTRKNRSRASSGNML